MQTDLDQFLGMLTRSSTSYVVTAGSAVTTVELVGRVPIVFYFTARGGALRGVAPVDV